VIPEFNQETGQDTIPGTADISWDTAA
jgi:hypothetical protein